MVYGATHYNNLDNIEISYSGDIVKFNAPVTGYDYHGRTGHVASTSYSSYGLDNIAPHSKQSYTGSIQLRIKDASINRRTGEKVDALIIIDDIYIENYSGINQSMAICGWWIPDNRLYLWSHLLNPYGDSSNYNDFSGAAGVRYRVNIKLVKAGTTSPVEGTFLYTAADLDQPAFTPSNPREYGAPFSESVEFISGTIGNPYISPDSTLEVVGNKIYGTANSSPESAPHTTVSTLADASGITFYWTGSNCATAIDLAYVNGQGKLQLVKQSSI